MKANKASLARVRQVELQRREGSTADQVPVCHAADTASDNSAGSAWKYRPSSIRSVPRPAI